MFSLSIPTDEGRRDVPLVVEELVVGSAEDSDLVIAHPGVAPRQARVWREGFTWFVDHLGSERGTFVNDARVRARFSIARGDRLRLGDFPHVIELVEHSLEREQMDTYSALQRATDAERLVYADELEMQGALDLANWVRAELELRQHATGTRGHARVMHELVELNRRVSPQQRALLARGPIESCGLPACPSDWSKLALTGSERLRKCGACQQRVTYCATVAEGRAVESKPIVVDASCPRWPGDVRPFPRPVVVG